MRFIYSSLGGTVPDGNIWETAREFRRYPSYCHDDSSKISTANYSSYDW